MAAVSIVPPHHYHHFDYFNLADPIRILDEFVDSPESETQMEFSGPASHNNSYLEVPTETTISMPMPDH